jgi:hypothetical protein
MEKLSNEINKNGFVYTLYKRGEKAMIYEQYDPEVERIVAYEIFRLKVDKPKVVFGIELGEREIFPGNEDFGKWAWACSTKERALERFERIETGEEDIEH